MKKVIQEMEYIEMTIEVTERAHSYSYRSKKRRTIKYFELRNLKQTFVSGKIVKYKELTFANGLSGVFSENKLL